MIASLDAGALATGTGAAIARIHIGLGDTASALDWLQRAAAAHDPFFSSESLASPVFDPIREDPAFLVVLDTVGLPHELAVPR